MVLSTTRAPKPFENKPQLYVEITLFRNVALSVSNMNLRVIYVVSVSLTCVNLLLIATVDQRAVGTRVERYEKVKKSVVGAFPTGAVRS